MVTVQSETEGRARPEIATEALGPASERRADRSQAVMRLIWVPFYLVDQGCDHAGPDPQCVVRPLALVKPCASGAYTGPAPPMC